MKDFLKKYRKIWIPAVTVVVFAGFIFTTTGDNKVTLGENLIGTVTKPFTSLFSNTFGKVTDFFYDYEKENSVLAQENATLKQNAVLLDETIAENKRLKELLNYQEQNQTFEYLTTDVTAKSGNYLFSSFTIGAGKSSNVMAGMPVISKDGLIGKVTESGATWSKVTSIIDSSSSVSAIVERTRDSGTVVGEIDTVNRKFSLKMEHLPIDTTIQPGDKIITSGLGGNYPKGIEIGIVSEVEEVSDGSKNVTITPSADFSRMEEVMIIMASNNKNFLE